MSRRSRTLLLATLALGCAHAQAALFSFGNKDKVLESFLRPETVSEASLSPDGKHLAMLGMAADSDDVIATTLVLVDTDTGMSRVIRRAQWVADPNNPAARTIMWQPVSAAWMSNDVLAVDYNFNTASQQVGTDGEVVGELGALFLGMIRLEGQKDKVAVVKLYGDAEDLGTVALGSKEITPLNLGIDSGPIARWLTDSTGLLRVLQTLETSKDADATRVATWYRASETDKWRKVIDQSITDDLIRPVFVSPEPNRLVVQARNGGDRLAMWNYDVEKKAFVDVAAAHPTEDIVAVEVKDGASDFKQVQTEGLKPQTVWFDGRMAGIQASIDAALPGHVNRLQATDGTQMLVTTSSDTDPGRYLVLDTKMMTLKAIAAARPEIAPAQMQPMQLLHYPSFDGLSIPAYLTLPGHPDKPAPTIVLIHGGPQARDHWGWHQDVQLYASRGYVVFQPQFRGSSGFGKHFQEAGYGQWGQAMQADITAGVRYLIDHKIADPDRICIIGGSYGGYAALWGLAQAPDLYKCGVSLAGVSDLEKEMRVDSDVSKSAIGREVWRSRVGDPTLMKTAFDDVSPLQHADRIKAPLLLAHGKLDERVPISQGRAMYERMRSLHKDVQWLDFSNEGHSLWHVENQRDYYDAVLKLLERTIGKGIVPENAPARP